MFLSLRNPYFYPKVTFQPKNSCIICSRDIAITWFSCFKSYIKLSLSIIIYSYHFYTFFAVFSISSIMIQFWFKSFLFKKRFYQKYQCIFLFLLQLDTFISGLDKFYRFYSNCPFMTENNELYYVINVCYQRQIVYWCKCNGVTVCFLNYHFF